jgi:RHS repeat-associated protein
MTAHFTGTQGTPDSATSYFMGGQYEVKDGATKKYYSIAGMMVATQDASGLQYLLTDHLGSTVAVTNASGTLTSQQRYLPFGGTRSIPNSPILATDFGYTGQRLLDAGMGGIMDYKARFYSPYLNRFLQPDTIIPDQTNPQSWNRFSYVINNPVNFIDPTGHQNCGPDNIYCGGLPDDNVPTSPVPPSDPPGGGGCNEDDDLCWMNQGDDDTYSNVWIDTTLSPEAVTVLFSEIDWWINAFQLGNVGFTLSELALLAGVVGIGLMLFAPTASIGAVSFVAAVGLLYLSNWTNNTLSDLQTLKTNLAVASGAYYQADENGKLTNTLIATKPVRLTAGNNMFNWGVNVNGKNVINHFQIPMYIPSAGPLSEFLNPQGLDEWIRIETWWHGFGN